MDNLYLYNKFRVCPPEAIKPIQGGKLKGYSDINPMYRIKALTEQFGPCGIGWKTYEETFWTTPGADGEVLAWCSIKLAYRDEQTSDWSLPVFGVGGSTMIAFEKGKLVSNDEAYKMAYTDAISVACKSLGVAADVYWEKDRTKYTQTDDAPKQSQKQPQKQGKKPPADICEKCRKAVPNLTKDGKVVKSAKDIVAWSKQSFDGHVYCWACAKEVMAQPAENAPEAPKPDSAGEVE